MTSIAPHTQDKTYAMGYQVFDVSPLSHYFEEIYGHTKGIEAIGPRGDRNYFWYSKDQKGSAYYEVAEQRLSAESTYEVLNDSKARKKYVSGVADVLDRAREVTSSASSIALSSLATEKVFERIASLWRLEADIFSYYLISQPYRLKLFEDEVRWELQKRVAKVKIDDYLARVVASPESTENAKEELSWSKLILDAKVRYGAELDKATIERDTHLYQSIQRHFEQFKLLYLGDGKWDFDFDAELDRFLADFKKPADGYSKRIEKIESQPADIAEERECLMRELELSSVTVETILFLSDMSHLRYTVRVNGFVPLIYYLIQTTKELAERLGYEDNVDLSFMTHEEFAATKKKSEVVVSLAELKRRRGQHDEYLVRINDGKVEYLFGDEAGELFAQLVPPVDHTENTELHGVAARNGQVKGSVTVFNWGDNMEAAITSIVQNPILIAGQTRPAMMPLIRMAKGIVTDEGGVTSHAAIIARELGIPTIINTGAATKTFSTGELVELDADSGVIRKVVE